MRGDTGGGDLGAEEVFCLILLHGHPVALGGFFEGFVSPDFGVEDGIGVEDVHAHTEGGELKGGDPCELGDTGFGDRVGGGARSGCSIVARADDDDAWCLVAFLEGGDGELEEALGRGEVDFEVEVPAVFWGVDVFARFKDASIGDDDVEATVVGDHFVDRGFEGRVIGDVTDGSRKAFSREVSDDVGVDVEADNSGAIVAQAFGSGTADTTTCSGDDGDFVGVDLIRHFDLSGEGVVKEGEVCDRIFVIKNSGSRDDEVGLHGCDLRDGVFVDATIDADEELGFPLEEGFDFCRKVVEEGLLGGVGSDAEEEDVVDLVEMLFDEINGGSGIDGDAADDVLMSRNTGEGVIDVSGVFDRERDEIGTGFGKGVDVLLGLVDEKVDVFEEVCFKTGNEGRADRDVGPNVSVHDIEVEEVDVVFLKRF